MRHLFIINFGVLFIFTGCTGHSYNASSQNAAECKPWSSPVMKDWVKYDRLECIWKSLQKEKVQSIGFCEGSYVDPNKGLLVQPIPSEESPEEWICKDITEPEKIKEVMKLLGKALKESNDRFANEKEVNNTFCGLYWMRIVTDKRKVIISIACFTYLLPNNAIRGVGWTSYELMGKLEQWTSIQFTELKCLWKYLEKEPIEKMAFCFGNAYESRDDWRCTDVTEPERIKEVLTLLEKAMEQPSAKEMSLRRYAGYAYSGYIQIATNKHKFITPFWYNCVVEGVYCGVDWTADIRLNKMLGQE